MPTSKPLTRCAVAAATIESCRAPEAVTGSSKAAAGLGDRSRAAEIAKLERRLSGLEEQWTVLCRCLTLRHWQSGAGHADTC